MDCQAKANQSRLRNKTQQQIKPDKPQLMQRMKANAAAVGVVDGVGQQMVDIHQHGGHKNKIGELPLAAKPLFTGSWIKR